MSVNKLSIYIFVLTLLLSCNKDKSVEENSIFMAKESDLSGITFSNKLVDRNDLNIIEYLYYYNGAGVATGDINNDGLDDIYFSGNQTPDQLYLNKGNLKFENITEKAGIKEYRITQLPEQKDPFQAMLEDFSTEVSTKITMEQTGESYKYIKAIQEILQLNGVQALSPYRVNF